MRRRRVHYAWVVFAVTFVALLGAAGFRSAPSVLIVPLEDDFGWSRGTISFALSVNLVLYGLAGPFAAALMGRFGLRRVVVGALATISLGALATTAMTAPWHLALLWGVVVGGGSGCLATVFAASVANRWFVARRGMVMGVLTAAGATGQLVFLPLLSSLAVDHGWRTVSIVIAVAALAGVPLVVGKLRDRPEDVGLRAYGAPPGHQSPPPQARPIRTAFDGLRLAQRSGAFWLLVGSFFVCGLSTNGLIGTHFVAAGMDHQMSETAAASLLALVGVFDVAGTVASGWLTDRVDPRRLLVAYYGLRGLSLLVLDHALAARNVGLLGFVVFYGLDWVATVPPTAALATEVFGPTRGAVVYGWVFAGHQLGAATAAWGAGVLHEHTGGYRISFLIAGACCLAAAAMVPRIGTAPARPAELTTTVASP